MKKVNAKDARAVELGRKGGSVCGKRKARSSEHCRAAALKRWGGVKRVLEDRV